MADEPGAPTKEQIAGTLARAGRQFLTVGVFGAGAPHAGLMAGALAYMYRKKKTFDIFFTSGGGALVGLLFVAARGKRPDEALREVAEFGVDDRIYRLFPVGYKVFSKQSWFTNQFHDLAQRFKLDVLPRPFPGQKPPPDYDAADQRRRRFYNDIVDFWASALTPPRIGPTSLGLCAHLPFLERLIDFRKANRPRPPSGIDLTVPIPVYFGPDHGPVVYELHPGWFYVNAYNLDEKRIDIFSNAVPANKTGEAGSLTPAAIRAALSFPFIYPPQEVKGSPYCEGALIDPLNLPRAPDVVVNRNIQKPMDKPEEVVRVRFYLFDILGSLEKQLMYCPRSLWEAYGLSILTPVISLAQMSKRIFRREYPSQLVSVKFKIPEKSRDRPLDWSYSNTTALWDAGWRAGRRFLEKHGAELPDRVDS